MDTQPRQYGLQDKGAQICGDIDLFVDEVDVPVVGITGSNGKSTVTSMVGQLLNHCGQSVAVGGNLGIPALDLLDPSIDIAVLELSSFQLERSGKLNLAAATVLIQRLLARATSPKRKGRHQGQS